MIAPKTVKPSLRDETIAYEGVTLRDSGSCNRCWSRDMVQRDHRRNRSQGGLTIPVNLQLLCDRCHSWKTNHPKEAVEQGWQVPGFGDPTVWPARRLIRTENGAFLLVWVVYGADYSVTEISADEAGARMRGEWS